jgi:serine/threonine protein kinase/Flp pilus assembly protein TadD
VSKCPTSDLLQEFLHESLAISDQPSLVAHVEECAACQVELERLSSSETKSILLNLRAALVETIDSQSAATTDEFFEALKRQTISPNVPRPEVENYEILEELGRGAVGVVYRARHLELNRFVALKVILAGAHLSSECQQRFRREAQVVARLQHPNIVQVFDVGQDAGCPYLVLELIEGQTLAQLLHGVPRHPTEAAEITRTLANAVGYAHRQGVIHRDLKPANVLVAVHQSTTGVTGGEAQSTIQSSMLKITDFGLAKSLPMPGLADDAITHSGATLGTPAYMAPEQARGRSEEIGATTDIYSLGVILYEMLTGRPPFQGATALETLLQSAHQDPVPPARLVPRIPNDLQTICMKCLSKEAHKRYDMAEKLADDLGRFLKHEPILARPVSWPEHALRWITQRPALSMLFLVSAVLLIVMIGGGIWLISEQAAVVRALENDLDEILEFQKRAAWGEADVMIQRATVRLGKKSVPAVLLQRLEHSQQDLELVSILEAVRSDRAEAKLQMYPFEISARSYERAFRDAELGTFGEEPSTAAARVKASNVSQALIAALDDWSACETDPPQQEWVLAVTRLADRDTTGLRARDPKTWKDKNALAELVRTATISDLSVPLLVVTGQRLQRAGGEASPFLKRVQQAYPDDFWANIALGDALSDEKKYADATRYFQAAIAIRPQSAVAFNNLGLALAEIGRNEESLDLFRKAIEFRPSAADFRYNSGLVLTHLHRNEDAIQELKHAVAVNPKHAISYALWGLNLTQLQRHEEAIKQVQQAIVLEPLKPEFHNTLRPSLIALGRCAECWRDWKTFVDLNSATHEACDGYAELSLFLGHDAEYRQARTALLARFGDAKDPHLAERTGRAALLTSTADVELSRAVILIDRALEADRAKYRWAYPYFQFSKGLADFRQGRLENAIFLLKGDASHVLGPAPRLVIALSQHRQGQLSAARKTLAEVVLSYDWTASRAVNREAWIYHILRREAESQILPHLAAYLLGQHQPTDNDERLGMLGACQFQDLTRAAAKIFRDLFTSDPALAEDLASRLRYRGACLAAKAGSGVGTDAATLPEAERIVWRNQALQWLREDLKILIKVLDSGQGDYRGPIRDMLTLWQAEAALSPMRDRKAFGSLTTKEQEDWKAFWSDCDGLRKRLNPTQ